MVGCIVADVFCGVIKKSVRGADANGGKRPIFQNAHGDFRAIDECFGEKLRILIEQPFTGARCGIHGWANLHVDAAATIDRLNHAWSEQLCWKVGDKQTARSRKPGTLPNALCILLVDPKSGRDRSTANEKQTSFFEDFLQFAALAESTVEDGEDYIAGVIQPIEMICINVALKHLVASCPQTVGDGSAADEGNLPLIAGSAAKNCDAH